jgi:hypothetical protein
MLIVLIILVNVVNLILLWVLDYKWLLVRHHEFFGGYPINRWEHIRIRLDLWKFKLVSI